MPAHFAESRLLIERVDRIDSTNSELLRRDSLIASDSGAAAVWLMARHQTSGRGRRQRSWLSSPDACLTASFAREVDSPARLGALSLVAGVAIAETLAGFGVDVRLKWPNDIHLGDGKVPGKAGGILCEARVRGPLTRIVIGCGLNLLRPDTATEIDQSVAGLFDPGRLPDRNRFDAMIGQALLQATDLLLADGFEAFRRRWSDRDMLCSRVILIHHYSGVTTAIARGIDSDGALLVQRGEHPGQLQRVLAEEVSVRPAESAQPAADPAISGAAPSRTGRGAGPLRTG